MTNLKDMLIVLIMEEAPVCTVAHHIILAVQANTQHVGKERIFLTNYKQIHDLLPVAECQVGLFSFHFTFNNILIVVFCVQAREGFALGYDVRQ